MIELDEKDIKVVARGRFVTKYEKQLIAILIGTLAAIIGLVLLTDRFEVISSYIAFIPVVGLFGYLVWYVRQIYKAEKELVEQWKQDKN